MTEIDRVEYASLQIKIRGIEEKLVGWRKQRGTIDQIIGLLEVRWSEAVKREKELQIKNGLSAGKEP